MAKDAPRMLSFGNVPRHSLGAWLARMTLEEVVRGVSLLDPELTVDPADIAWVHVLGQKSISCLSDECVKANADDGLDRT